MNGHSLERRLERLERVLRLVLKRLDFDEHEIEELEDEIGQPSTYPKTVSVKVSVL